MKHRQDWSLQKNLIYALVLFNRIKTTKSKAKAISGLVDKLVNKLKKGTVSAKRGVLAVLPSKGIMEKFTGQILPALSNRHSGYTRIIKIGRRSGDGADMVFMEWVVEPKMINEIKIPEVEQAIKVKKESHVKTNQAK